jgi:hypothetical protein
MSVLFEKRYRVKRLYKSVLDFLSGFYPFKAEW